MLRRLGSSRLLSCNLSSGPDHGQELSRETRKVPTKQVCNLILDHFDKQYTEELGPIWPSTRAVLLNPGCWQYGVMLNRFTSVSELKRRLQGHGFTPLLPHPNSPSAVSPAPTPHLPPTPQIHSSQHHLSFTETFPNYADISLPQPNAVISQPYSLDDSLHQLNTGPHPFPSPSLQCFIHPSAVRFPSPPHRQGQLKPYYLLNAASLLPVLALGVKDGDRVLDLCSAPGGKALAIIQAANPALLCCNEVDPHRRDWLAKTLESFIPQSLSSAITVSNQDGRIFGQTEAGMYDKVLVDAPCSNDRSWLFSSGGGEQRGCLRLKERARLPTLQMELLRSALAAVRPGGVVVYSTCTLSRSENQDVVKAVLNTFPGAELDDLEEEVVLPLQQHFTFAPPCRPHALLSPTLLGHTPSCGLLVVPHPGQTWGPMFLSRIKRTH
ncbi:tRNA (cytosine(34)-C(5))-methyltransferase, mitochondrial isoform X1 [Esox lucius]|uniref:SAM-dependent MTase RsmB/NOP-type domain-containing protein n=1 Tax=Esox lucius TaxID=8010 RepID=A0A3P8XEE6_ESOLU|nr:tRNA (cytosine(34)-C(5))-methyltransferase, mitochondrial isoform X1 [Esox lucius]